MRSLAICLTSGLLAAAPLGAQSDPLPATLAELHDLAARLEPWDQHSADLVRAVENFCARQGWTSETDRFALELVRQVEALPPAAVWDRLETAVALLRTRYELDAEQEAFLRGLILRESAGLLMRHAVPLAQYARELVETRLAGEPFTAEQVRRWTHLTEPVWQDARRRVAAAAAEFCARLDPPQRARVEADLRVAMERLAEVDALRGRWAAGHWQPDDWGLQDDPVHQAAMRAADAPRRPAQDPIAPAAPDGPGPRPDETPRAVAQTADDPWAAYVQRFIAHYHLRPGQQHRAWQTYRRYASRRDSGIRQDQARFDALRRSAAAGDPAAQRRLEALLRQRHAQHERLFAGLREELDRLVTAAQRRAAGPFGPAGPSRAARSGSSAPAPGGP